MRCFKQRLATVEFNLLVTIAFYILDFLFKTKEPFWNGKCQLPLTFNGQFFFLKLYPFMLSAVLNYFYLSIRNLIVLDLFAYQY